MATMDDEASNAGSDNGYKLFDLSSGNGTPLPHPHRDESGLFVNTPAPSATPGITGTPGPHIGYLNRVGNVDALDLTSENANGGDPDPDDDPDNDPDDEDDNDGLSHPPSDTSIANPPSDIPMNDEDGSPDNVPQGTPRSDPGGGGSGGPPSPPGSPGDSSDGSSDNNEDSDDSDSDGDSSDEEEVERLPWSDGTHQVCKARYKQLWLIARDRRLRLRRSGARIIQLQNENARLRHVIRDLQQRRKGGLHTEVVSPSITPRFTSEFY